MEYLTDPQYQFGLASVVLLMLAIIFLRWLARREKRVKRIVDPQLQRLLHSGNHEAAARYEQQRGNYQEALDLFLVAQRPGQAANMALRLDQPRKAAELFERAKDYRRAGRYYKEAGLNQRAVEMEKLLAARGGGA